MDAISQEGITPVIALVMLLLITVGMVGISYAWSSGMLVGNTEKTFAIPAGGAYCIKVGGLNTIFVIVRNTGATSNLVSGIGGDFVITRLDGSQLGAQSFDIPPSGSATFFNYNCGTGCNSGAHFITISTRNTLAETRVLCP